MGSAMTTTTELLTVTDHFDITGRGLVLLPDFDPPSQRNWENFSAGVVVLTPMGERLELKADFWLIHFNIRDPNVDMNKRWRVSVALPSATKQMVPIGSRLLCEADVRATLFALAARSVKPASNR
jgi:hypothetical protein